jgi:transposase
MLGLPGFVVLAVSEVEGELEQAIETTADLWGCPECGVVAELHDRRPCWVRDLPAGGRTVMLVWVKRHCCVGGKQSRLSEILSQSDNAGEFHEGRCESMPWVDSHVE